MTSTNKSGQQRKSTKSGSHAESSKEVRMANAMLTTENSRLNRVLETQLTNVDSLMISNTNLRNRFEKMTSILSSKEQDIMQLQGSKNRLNSQLSDAQDRNLKLSDAQKLLREDIQRLRNNNSRLEFICDDKQDKLRTALNHNRALIDIVEKQREELKKAGTATRSSARAKRFKLASTSLINKASSAVKPLLELLRIRSGKLRDIYNSKQRVAKIKGAEKKRKKLWQRSAIASISPVSKRQKHSIESFFVGH